MDKKIDFKKKRKFTLLIGIFCIVGALCYGTYLYSNKFVKDINGFSKQDVKEAFYFVENYLHVINEQDKEAILQCLSKENIQMHQLNEESRIQQALTSICSVKYINTELRYEKDSWQYKNEMRFYNTRYPDEEIICINAEFDIESRDDAQFIGSWENLGYNYYVYFLIRENNEWKLLDCGK